MSIKKYAKYSIGKIRAIKFKVKHSGIYIGKSCKIVGGRGINCEKNISIAPYSLIMLHNESQLNLGENFQLGMFSRIAVAKSITIGKNVFTGPNVFIADYNHEYQDIEIPIWDQGNSIKENGGVVIGDDCWIGTNVVISGTINIGNHCIVGANSVVTKNVPDYSVVAGSPAKLIKYFDFEIEKWINCVE